MLIIKLECGLFCFSIPEWSCSYEVCGYAPYCHTDSALTRLECNHRHDPFDLFDHGNAWTAVGLPTQLAALWSLTQRPCPRAHQLAPRPSPSRRHSQATLTKNQNRD